MLVVELLHKNYYYANAAYYLDRLNNLLFMISIY